MKTNCSCQVGPSASGLYVRVPEAEKVGRGISAETSFENKVISLHGGIGRVLPCARDSEAGNLRSEKSLQRS